MNGRLGILSVLTFLSGASALIYQVLWLRTLSLIFGVTVYAASTLLAIFMAGLSLGSALGGRLSDGVRRPLIWFGFTEIAIGITALLGPLALDVITMAYVRGAEGVTSRTALTVIRVACAAVVLLPPAILMGMTSPLALRASAAQPAAMAGSVALLYATNTAGAIAGALLAGFVLMGGIGMRATFMVAAGLNLIVALAALMLTRTFAAGAAAAHPQERESASTTPARRRSQVVLTALTLSGGTTMALEVVWFRTLVLYYPATTYAFTAMLATVLGGITAGSLVCGPILRKAVPTLSMFGLLHASAGLLTLAGAGWLAAAFDPSSPATGLLAGASLAVLPPAVALGAAFPAGVRIALSSTGGAPGSRLGIVYALNLAGAIAGSLLGGFALLPVLGSARSLTLLAGVSVFTGLIAMAADSRRAPRLAWPLIVASLIVFLLLAPKTPDPFTAGLARRHRDAGRVFMRDEGVQTTVSVHMRERGGRQLFLDGLHQASDGQDVVTLHRRIGHLPVLLHAAPKRALVIGLGGGATAGAVSLHPDLQVEIVELAPGVVKAAEWFAHINEDVLRRPHVQLSLNDARNHLLFARQPYDVITADIIQPTHAGAGLLYSREYFELARRALNPGGVMVQWVGLRSAVHYKLIARTFQQVFPETSVWVHGSLLIGSIGPLPMERAGARRHVPPVLQRALSDAGLGDPGALMAQFTAGPGELRRYVGDGPTLTDDRPLLEYFLSLPDDGRAVDVSALQGRGIPSR